MSGISLRRYSVSPALTNLFVIHCVITPMSFWTLLVNNNADTSYSIRLSIALLTNDNVSMSVGHLDHVSCWLFTTRWSTWPGNHLVPCPCVSELVRSCIPIHAHRCLPDLKFLFYPSGLSLCLSVDHFWLYQLNESIQHYYLQEFCVVTLLLKVKVNISGLCFNLARFSSLSSSWSRRRGILIKLSLHYSGVYCYLLLVCVSLTIIGQPWNSIFIRRV